MVLCARPKATTRHLWCHPHIRSESLTLLYSIALVAKLTGKGKNGRFIYYYEVATYMINPQPQYQEAFSLNQLDYGLDPADEISKDVSEIVLTDAAANRILQYMRSQLYMPCSNGMDGAKYSGLAGNGSLVILEGLRQDSKWCTASVTVVNMQEKDEGLVELLKKVAIKAD